MDAQRLLDQFLGTKPTHRGPVSSRQPHRSASGGIEDMIGKAMSGALGGGSHGRAGSGVPAALAGGLASYLLRGKRRRRYGASKLGGMALVAGLAYKAFQQYQAHKQSSASASPAAGAQGVRMHEGTSIPSAEGTRFQPSGTEADERARLMLSAMIAAAKADGYIDREEQEAIFGRIDDLDLDAETKGFVMDEMRKPLSIDEIVRRTPNQEVAMEVYTASVMAIDPDHPAEKAYLDLLAARLDLPAGLVAEIRRTTGELEE